MFLEPQIIIVPSPSLLKNQYTIINVKNKVQFITSSSNRKRNN